MEPPESRVVQQHARATALVERGQRSSLSLLQFTNHGYLQWIVLATMVYPGTIECGVPAKQLSQVSTSPWSVWLLSEYDYFMSGMSLSLLPVCFSAPWRTVSLFHLRSNNKHKVFLLGTMGTKTNPRGSTLTSRDVQIGWCEHSVRGMVFPCGYKSRYVS